MPLLVQNDNAYMEYILPDIFHIVDGDTSVGDEKTPDPAWISVTYNHIKQGFAQTQFFNIVHGTPNYQILLRYVQSDFILPEDPDPQTGQPKRIAQVQGATYGPGVGNQNPDGSGVILVYLDAYNDAGANYWVRGQDGSQIFSPRWVQLFHELSHALHIARGQVTKNTPDAQEDALTIGDENQLRAQYQGKYPWLKQRNLNEEGGQGATDPDPKVNNPTPKSGCFIVSAAYGSADAEQVTMLKLIKDAYSQKSVLVGWFLSELITQYYRFSPPIASEMQKSPPLRSAIALFLVKPLMCYFILLDQYFRFGSAALFNVIEPTLASQMAELCEHSTPKEKANLIYAELLGLKTRFARQDNLATSPPSPPILLSSSEVLHYFFESIDSSAPPNGWLEWAIMEPLTLYWTVLAKMEDSPWERIELAKFWIGAVDEWLKRVPIPPIFVLLHEDQIKAELINVAEAFFTSPSVREGFAHRLIAQFGDRVPYDLRAVLQEVSYLPVPMSGRKEL